MNVLLTGASGQVGKELVFTCPKNISLIALDKYSLDICELHSIKTILNIYKPDLVINAAAYTSVEKAEFEDESAYKINRDAIRNLALECYKNDIKLIHYSTDYIFDGFKNTPYTIKDKPNPINIYGKSKLEGEIAVLNTCSDNALIIRTSWVYSKYGNNFVKTILKLMNKKEKLKVIRDQVGAPTWARSIAIVTWKLLKFPNANGILHFTDNGTTNWYEFAKAIKKEANLLKLSKSDFSIYPITSDNYDSPVNRPKYSVLDCSETFKLISNYDHNNWKTNLRLMLNDLNN